MSVKLIIILGFVSDPGMVSLWFVLAPRPFVIQDVVKAEVFCNNGVFVIILVSSIVLVVSRWLAVLSVDLLAKVAEFGIIKFHLSLCFNLLNHLGSLMLDNTHLVFVVPVDFVL